MRSVDFLAISSASQVATVNGTPMDSRQLLAVSVQAVVTGGDAAGTIKLQFSNDVTDPVMPAGAVPTNWTDITSASVAVSGAAVYGIMKTELCYQFIRAVYVRTSGTSVIAVRIKGLGF